MPASSRRRRATTSSVESFSATNMTVRPVDRARKMRFATVCDLPVPGGPLTTRLRPAAASAMTRAWSESASSGRFSTTSSMSAPAAPAASSAGPPPAGSAKAAPGASRRCPTTGLETMVGQSVSRSCHMR